MDIQREIRTLENHILYIRSGIKDAEDYNKEVAERKAGGVTIPDTVLKQCARNVTFIEGEHERIAAATEALNFWKQQQETENES